MNYFDYHDRKADKPAPRQYRVDEIVWCSPEDLTDTIRTHLDQQRMGIIVEEHQTP